MKLNDLDKKNHAARALKENFNIKLDVANLDRIKTKNMLTKVTGLISEAKQSPSFYKNQTSDTYMKLIFIEQALRSHYRELSNRPSTRIVVENEEVAKSQAILAAQDMIDTVQKMLEDINDMMVKELPALVSSIQSDIGASESQSFNEQAREALDGINQALQSSKTTLEGALGSITGEGAPAFDEPVDDGTDLDMDMNTDDLGMDDGADLDMDMEIDEPISPVGRAKR